MKNRSVLVLWYAVALQGLWGVALLVSSNALRPTPLGPVTYAMPHRLAGAIYVATSALAAMALRRSWSPARDMLALMPQQALLILSAVGSAQAILAGHYADGVPRPHLFILIDQSPAVLMAAWHSWSVYLHASRA